MVSLKYPSGNTFMLLSCPQKNCQGEESELSCDLHLGLTG